MSAALELQYLGNQRVLTTICLETSARRLIIING